MAAAGVRSFGCTSTATGIFGSSIAASTPCLPASPPVSVGAMLIRPSSNLIHLARLKSFSREEAYMIASVAVDYHVTQVVDGTKGIHGMIPKAIFAGQ